MPCLVYNTTGEPLELVRSLKGLVLLAPRIPTSRELVLRRLSTTPPAA